MDFGGLMHVLSGLIGEYLWERLQPYVTAFLDILACLLKVYCFRENSFLAELNDVILFP